MSQEHHHIKNLLRYAESISTNIVDHSRANKAKIKQNNVYKQKKMREL